MNKSIQFLISELKKIRAGKATPNMLESIMVEYYGTATPLIQVASITTPDSRTLFIKPWEKTIIQDIEKSIQNSDLGLLIKARIFKNMNNFSEAFNAYKKLNEIFPNSDYSFYIKTELKLMERNEN